MYMLNVAVIDPPRDTGGIEVSHYLLQVDSGSGVNCLLICFFIVHIFMSKIVTIWLDRLRYNLAWPKIV